MRSKLCYFGLISLLLFLMLSGIMIILVSNLINQREEDRLVDYPLDDRASTDKNNPVTLQKDAPIFETLPNETVYYKTGVASSSSFQVIWQKCTSGHSLLLSLYPNSSYTSILFQTGIIIAKPDYSREMYVRCEPQTPETSTAYFEWKEASKLNSGVEITGTLAANNYVDVYEITLDSTRRYDFTLTVPAGSDYDMMINLANYSISGYTGSVFPIKSNVSDVDGMDEIISNWNPPETGVYIIIIGWSAGTGAYTLTFNCTDCPIPINSAMMFIGLFIGLLIYMRKGKKITA